MSRYHKVRRKKVETVTELKQEVKTVAESELVRLYLNTILAFKGLPITLSPLVQEFMGQTIYTDMDDENSGQLIVMNARFKERISKKLGLKLNTIAKALTELTKKEILLRAGQGMYFLNPAIFGTEQWKDIKTIHANFDFNTREIDLSITRGATEMEEA
jgi:hypothetical protein